MAINLHAYNFYQFDDLTFLFTTQARDEYQCYFLSYADYFASQPDIAPNFFSFNLKLISNEGVPIRKGTDKRLADTVIAIVGDFLSSKSNAVVYVCDNSDGKERARSRKFLSWFDYYDHPSSKIIQVTSNFTVGGLFIYSSLLVHKNNKRFKDMILAYLDLTKDDDK
jgi:Family of unknown function (DUF6169)